MKKTAACVAFVAVVLFGAFPSLSSPSSPAYGANATPRATVPTTAEDFRRATNDLDDVFAASCRVNVSGARGSGTFNGVKDGLAYISTNYHVVSNQKSATVDFWTNGVKQTLAGRVAWRAYDANLPADFAFIVVDADELKRTIDPPYVALGGSDAKPSVNSFFLSSGGPKGWSVKAWKGKILDYYNGETVLFQPHPVPGQSGSGVFEEIDGELFQVGIITWLIGAEGDDASKGGAIPISNLYKALKTHPYNVAAPNNENGSPIPPDAVECELEKAREIWNSRGAREIRLDPQRASETVSGAISARPAKLYLGGVKNERAGLGYLPAPSRGFSDVVRFSSDSKPTKDAATIYYFTAPNCPACDMLAAPIGKINAAQRVPFEIVDASTPEGLALATRYNVELTPTAIVVDYAGAERGRVSFEEMRDKTPAAALADAYNAAVRAVREELQSMKSDEEDQCDSASEPCPVAPYRAETTQTPAEDFRKRAAHYEIPPQTGFFDDSEDRWRLRGGRARRSAPSQNPPQTPPLFDDERDDATPQTPQTDENERSARLFSRLGDRLENRLSGAIENAAKNASGEIVDQLEGRIKDALGGDVSALMDGIESGVQEKIENAAKTTAKRYAKRALWLAFGLFLLASIVSQLVFAVLRRARSSFRARVATYIDAFALAAKSEQTTKKETK